MAEFGIDEEPTYKNGQWHLVGRCGTNIRVGDRFTYFIPHRVEVHPNGDRIYYEEEALGIDLTILEIHRYGRMLQEWDAGQTALLVLSGDRKNLGEFGSLVTELSDAHAAGKETGRIQY